MSVAIRNATIEDENNCEQLLNALTAATQDGEPPRPMNHPHFRALLSGERGQIVVAEEDNELLGMATVSYNLALRYAGEYCQLEELIVAPAARGKNVGGLLVKQTIKNAEERGCSEYGLYLVPSTEHNRAFYAKYGFAPVGTELRQPLPQERS